MSDDEDYMSCTFLNATEDIRPGLIYSKGLKRKYDIERKRVESNKVHRTKSHNQLEEEARESGLENAIGSDNKGYTILEKMGYKPGMKLGAQKKSSCSMTGINEPIKIKLKKDRGGLGIEEEINQKIIQKEKKRKFCKEQKLADLTREYQNRMRNKALRQCLMTELRKSQRVCEQLDSENSLEEPMRSWFWYSQAQIKNEEEEVDDDELEPEEQLVFILDYLRSKYLYCLWCGIRYNSNEELCISCPGIEKEDHDV